MIRSDDLRPGDVLVDDAGRRWVLDRYDGDRPAGWWARRADPEGNWASFLPDSRIETSAHRSLWLDESVPR